jgi:Nitroreductase
MATLEVAHNSDIFTTIKSRRSTNRLTDEVPSRQQIERILTAATYAPNHHKNEPWKFFVLTGKSREHLGRVMADALAQHMEETQSEKAQAQIQKTYNRPQQTPVVIAVAVESTQRVGGRDIENVAATAAAVQNMLLTAQSLGLATMWRTGDAAYDPAVKAWFGLQPDEHLLAFVYVGYPAVHLPERVPTSFQTKTTWLNDEVDR